MKRTRGDRWCRFLQASWPRAAYDRVGQQTPGWDMTDNLISVKEFAESNGLLRQTVFKVLKRLGIEPTKSRGGSQNRGQTKFPASRNMMRVRCWRRLLRVEIYKTGKMLKNRSSLKQLSTTSEFFICCAWSQSTIPAASRLALPTTLTSACGNCGVQRHIHKWSRHGHVGGFGRKPQ